MAGRPIYAPSWRALRPADRRGRPEGEAADALGREYYVRGAAPGAGYRNGYRTGRLKTAEGMVEYAAPQICDRAVPFRSRLHEIICGPERGTGCARTVYARYRSAVCRRARPIAVERHGGERDHAATVGGIRGFASPICPSSR